MRIGLVGANTARGWARDAHVPALRTLPDLPIQAVSARTMAIAEAARTAFGATSAYDDSLALAGDPDVDIVAVCVKVPEHRAVVLAALAAGKHVYCEWPLGRDTAQAEEMAAAAAAAAAHGVHAAIGLQGAGSAAVHRAADLVRLGTIGTLRSLNMVSPTAGWGSDVPDHYAYLQDSANGATLLSIAGGHSMAAIEALAGDYLDLSATGSSFAPLVAIGDGRTMARTGFDHLTIVGRHASGCVSTLELVAGVTTVPFRCDLRGSTGHVAIVGGHVGGFQSGELSIAAEPAAQTRSATTARGAGANLARMYGAFAADIRNGTQLVAGFGRAVRLHRLLDAVEAAAASGHRTAVQGSRHE